MWHVLDPLTKLLRYASVTDVTVQASLAFHMDLLVVDVYDF